MRSGFFRRALVAAVATAGTLSASGPAQPGAAPLAGGPSITVFAASDLGPPFKQIVPAFERETATKVTVVLGSTGMLAQQIRNGAPADVFFAANEAFIAQLSSESLTIDATRRVYARGRIATVTARRAGARIDGLEDLAQPRVRRIAIANPAHAPYGLAARQALEAAGLWKAVQPKLVYGENVQQAMQFVRSGSADAGIVARSVADAPDVIWALVDEQLHAPLDQVCAVLARTRQPAASTTFIQFVGGTQGRGVMRGFGFELPD